MQIHISVVLATTADLSGMESGHYGGDSWGEGLNGSFNRGFIGSNGGWYYASSSIPTQGIRAFVKLIPTQMNSDPKVI